jgi:hypothetical protein
VLLVGLRCGTCAASLGADDDLRFLTSKLRAVWPDVSIHVRGDSGFGVPVMYHVCEELNLTYTFGFQMNSRVKTLSNDLLSHAEELYQQTGVKQRLFMSVWYQADSWDHERFIIIKWSFPRMVGAGLRPYDSR